MKIVERRCRAKSKKYNNSDRLLIDKDYLSTLSKGIGTRPDVEIDDVELGVSETAYEALDFLHSREKFWSQINVGDAGKAMKSKNNKSHTKRHT